jgi:uncharacterized protein (DUF3084 family)
MTKKIYILVPIIATALFAFYYMGFAKEYEEAELQKIEDAKQIRRDQMLQEAEDRKQAIAEALALNAERKAAREAKEAEDLAKKEAREAARDERDIAYRDRNKLDDKVKDLDRQIAEVKASIAEVEAKKKLLIDEEKFLQTFVVAANANVNSLERVLQQIKDANDAAAAAAALAAATANAKK